MAGGAAAVLCWCSAGVVAVAGAGAGAGAVRVLSWEVQTRRALGAVSSLRTGPCGLLLHPSVPHVIGSMYLWQQGLAERAMPRSNSWLLAVAPALWRQPKTTPVAAPRPSPSRATTPPLPAARSPQPAARRPPLAPQQPRLHRASCIPLPCSAYHPIYIEPAPHSYSARGSSYRTTVPRPSYISLASPRLPPTTPSAHCPSP